MRKLPAVTPHYCIRELRELSPLPLIDLLQVVRDRVEGQRVALFGSRFSIESDLFSAAPGSAARMQPEEITEIDEIYVRIALSGVATPKDHERLTAIAQQMLGRDGLDAIVLAGTDLASLFNAETTAFPFIDCAALHIGAVMEAIS